ncbi:MAG TPA: nodulation protein NfeD, partial [Roseiflexaceae bacterium]|nr:nodulation protein NfeD [Roseiflexaceae bacterium]
MADISRAVLALAVALLLAASGRAAPAAAQQAAGPIYAAEVRGPVTAVTVGYLQRALALAEASNAGALIITLSNRGGVLAPMRLFAATIAQARVPVVVYVAPGIDSGAAGALFLSAAHVSAMGPGSSFGIPAPLAQVDAALSQQTRDLVLDSVAHQLRTWNTERGRGAAWVDRAVRTGVVIDNQQASAASPPVVDLVAADREQLLTLLDGRIVQLANGRRVQLATLGRTPTPAAPTLWEGLRMALADPTLVFILLVLGALAIYVELAIPGTTVFAGIGALLLAGALAGLLALPVNGWALLLLLLAFALVGAEFFAPTHGALAVGGIALLIVGGANLFDPLQAPGATLAGG